MDVIPVRLRRLLVLAIVYAILVLPVLVMFDLRQAIAAAAMILLLLVWLFPGGNRREIPQDKTIGTEGHDVGNWDPDKDHEP